MCHIISCKTRLKERLTADIKSGLRGPAVNTDEAVLDGAAFDSGRARAHAFSLLTTGAVKVSAQPGVFVLSQYLDDSVLSWVKRKLTAVDGRFQ